MKNITKTLLVVMALVLALAAFTACLPTTPTACEHTGGTATCEAAAVCEKCGESYGEALSHSFTDYVSNNDATCTENGTKTAKCDNCEATDTVADEGSVIAHDYTEKIVDADHLKSEATNCQEVDVYWYDCSVCDSISDELYYDSENAGEHSLATEWTTEDGYHFHECTVAECDYIADNAACSDIDTDEDHKCDVCDAADVTSHAYGAWEKADDNHKQTCNCGDVNTEDHDWNDGVITKDPSHTEKGELTKTCTVCKATKTEELPVLTECTYNQEKAEDKYIKSEATCTDKAVYYKSCICGEFSNAEDAETFTSGDPIDHTFDQENIELEGALKSEANCGSAAVYYKSCSCGAISDTETFEYGSALDHNYVTTYKWSDDNSTCTASKVCENNTAHVENEVTATVSTVALNVTATKVTYTYNVVFANNDYLAQTKTVEADVTLTNSIATINAPAIAERVASHDYVKFDFHDEEATYTFTIYYSECDVWDGTSVSESLSGSGTEETPYLIQSAADFAYLQTCESSGKYFKLMVSIDFNNNALSIASFAGNLDGNNCSIRGINLTNTEALTGLFKTLEEGSQVSNLTLYGTVSGAAKTGALAGESKGNVTNVTNYANVTGTEFVGGIIGAVTAVNNEVEISNCTNNGTLIASATSGGILGAVESNCVATIINCTNNANVSTGWVIGGIAGYAKDGATITISGCVNNGNFTGNNGFSGILGQVGEGKGTATATINNCTNNGDVTGANQVGGIVGNVEAGSTVTITKCENYGNISGKTAVGGILGNVASSNSTGTITECTNYGDITSSGWTGSGGIAGKLYGSVSDCTNEGNINGNAINGGIVGVSYGSITNCTNKGNITTKVNSCGGIVGELHGTALEANVLATNTNTGTITCSGSDKGDIIGQTKA